LSQFVAQQDAANAKEKEEKNIVCSRRDFAACGHVKVDICIPSLLLLPPRKQAALV
jgi:hypothetical protein